MAWDDDASSTDSFISSSSDSVPWHRSKSESNADCYRLALGGVQLPSLASLRRNTYARQCAIRGIRHNLAFAKSDAVVTLCTEEANQFPELVRARNARLIMSDEIPDMDHDVLFQPYCIWFPDLAREDTYKELAHRYPSMRYNAGRACAVAGYATLYRTLNLLPDVCIAEEARDNAGTSGAIFTEIMASPVRYAVMNDYTRAIQENSPRIAFLNNDTAVRSSMTTTERPDGSSRRHHMSCHWDITEDGGAHEEVVDLEDPPLQPNQVALLHSPLPLDLPAVNKDLFILMAAYEGGVDRYARLRRPHMIQGEHYCIMRGIYHSTTFARWWSDEVEADQARLGPEISAIRQAINARFIMSNDLSHVARASVLDMPYMIWYPQWPRQETLEKLARTIPVMKRQVAHACIVADYQKTYDSLDAEPHPVLYLEAKNSANPYYTADLERRAALQGLDITRNMTEFEKEEAKFTIRDKEPTSTWLYTKLTAGIMELGGLGEGLYDRGDAFSSNKLDLFICATEEMKRRAARQGGGWMTLHVPWIDDGVEEDER